MAYLQDTSYLIDFPEMNYVEEREMDIWGNSVKTFVVEGRIDKKEWSFSGNEQLNVVGWMDKRESKKEKEMYYLGWKEERKRFW